MANPFQSPKEIDTDSRGVSGEISPVLVLFAGALSSSLLGGVLGYDGSGDGELQFAFAIAFAFFVAGAICSLVPALVLRRKLIADIDRPPANPLGYVLFAVFCVPVVSAIFIFCFAIVVMLVAALTGNLAAT